MALIFGIGIAATTGGLLSGIGHWGHHDWDYFYFQSYSLYRSFYEFHELPLWNPWYMGGVPSVGNFQSNFPNPWSLLNLAAGPVVSIKLMIVIHQVLGLGSMYWMARGLRMSRLAAVYVAGTFFFSSWLALRIHTGHLTYLCTAYLPLLVGLFARARTRASSRSRPVLALVGGLIVALMILQGGIYDVIFASSVLGPLTVVWCLKDRTARPLITALMVAGWAVGLSAVKLIPVVTYLKENPRTTGLGVSVWLRNLETLTPESAPPGSLQVKEGEKTSTIGKANIAPTVSQTTSELMRLVARIFLGREQVSNQIYFDEYPVQDYGWHEFGTYVGPLWLILVVASPVFASRQSGPWLLIALICFSISAGNIQEYAPWCLIHRLPVFKSMHCPSRFLIPGVFAASISAGFALDALRLKFASSRPTRDAIVIGLVVLAALVDSVLVFRHAVKDAFPIAPPVLRVGSPDLVTIQGGITDMTLPMLANQCSAQGYEPINPKVWVKTVDAQDYQGEAYFRPDAGASEALRAKVEIVGWSPNTVTVRASCPSAGWIVLNRNWNEGWRTDSPYLATRLDGLISSRVVQGEHLLHFSFVPKDFWLGLGISLVTIGCGGAGLVRWRSARVDSGPEVA